MIRRSLYLLFLGNLLSCATIFNLGYQSIPIHTTPPEASFTILDSKGEIIYEGITPELVKLKRRGGYFLGEKYTVIFEKEGYQCRRFAMEYSLNHWYWGNLLIVSPAGFLLVDPLAGGMWTLAPEKLSVELQSLQ